MVNLAPLSLSAGSPLNRVRSLSRRMQWVVISGGILTLAPAIIFWFWSSDVELERAMREAVQATAATPVQVSLPHRTAGFLISGGGLALLLCALYQAHRMLGAFARGDVFTIDTAIRLRRIALTIAAFGLVAPLGRLLLGLVLVGAPGDWYWAVVLSTEDYFTCLLGGLLLAIAWVMVEAVRLAEENDSFV